MTESIFQQARRHGAPSLLPNSGLRRLSDTQGRERSVMAMLLLVKTGAVVTWTNTDDEPHIVSCDRAQTRSAVETEEKLTFVCDEPGTYHFTCSTHPRVILTLVVE